MIDWELDKTSWYTWSERSFQEFIDLHTIIEVFMTDREFGGYGILDEHTTFGLVGSPEEYFTLLEFGK